MKSFYGLEYRIVDLNLLSIATKIQQEIWPSDPDFDDIYEKAIHPTDDNCFFLVYHQGELIGLTGLDTYAEYPETIWLDWFTILPEFRRKGYGKKVLLDMIHYCKELKRFSFFRVETTYYENRPALFLYDSVMQLKEEYTVEDTDTLKNQTLIYSYALYGPMEAWNNKYLGLREYYDNLKPKATNGVKKKGNLTNVLDKGF